MIVINLKFYWGVHASFIFADPVLLPYGHIKQSLGCFCCLVHQTQQWLEWLPRRFASQTQQMGNVVQNTNLVRSEKYHKSLDGNDNRASMKISQMITSWGSFTQYTKYYNDNDNNMNFILYWLRALSTMAHLCMIPCRQKILLYDAIDNI